MKIEEEIIKGIFVKERKNRFLAEVKINNKLYECYIPSSSKLQNYINLKGKEVLLKKNKDIKARTEFSVFAVKYYGKYIILNLNSVNKVVKEYIEINQEKKIKQEKYINTYKSDLLIEDTKVVIEIKALISTKQEAIFPTVYSERAIKQLKKIRELLTEEYKINYYFISLSSSVKKIIINKEEHEYYNLLKDCINNGMIIYGYNIKYSDSNIYINKKIKVEI